jgi:GAF domain-containing protein
MSEPDGRSAPDARAEATLGVLRLVAREAAIARRLQGDIETELLQSVVDAAARLFDAGAASIALYDAEVDRLTYRVASGIQGGSVIGVSVTPSSGIAGHVFSTGEATVVADVTADPRFDADTARRTGYLPRSLAAVPLTAGAVRVGVLQVLDKRAADGFSTQDMELLAAFARQAAAAIEAARAGRDTHRLIRDVIAAAAGDSLDDAALDTLVSAAATELPLDGSTSSALVEVAAAWQGRSEADVRLLTEIVEAFAQQS